VADALKREPGVQVKLEDGGKGEFTVLIGGQPMAKKDNAMPSPDEVVAAVRGAPTAGSAAA
jgi:hypothetical protein